MRLIPVCLPLVLAPLLVAGQQAQTSTPQKPAQTSTAKQTTSSPHKTTTRHRKRHRSRKAAARKRAKRAGLCSDSQFSADVIMGEEVRHVCLDKSQLAGNAPKAAPGQMKVDVINGSATDTQFFSDKNQESAHNQAVVVDVQSSDTRFAGKKTPVVTGVTSSSSVDATSASSGGQAVTTQVSPRPKRPAYEPDTH